jgi:hypothetical protein
VRRADLFFYGLFMDEELLRAKGVDPRDREHATVDDVSLRIGERATLVPTPGGRVHGVVCALTLSELNRLYAEPSLQAYRAEAVLAHLASGGMIAALCYILPDPPSPSERNPDYADKLRTLAQKIGLPADYVASLR